VRANGMGQTGVALMGKSAFYYNPGSLGFLGRDNRGVLSSYPQRTKWRPEVEDWGRYDAHSLAVSLPKGLACWEPLSVGFAYYRSRLYGALVRTSFTSPRVVGLLSWKDIANNYVLGVGLSTVIDVGAGITYKRISETVGDFALKGGCVDFGLLLRLPLERDRPGGKLVITPSCGIAWSNYGPDVKRLSASYKLPKTRRIGAALEIGVNRRRMFEQWMLWSLVGTLEGEKLLVGSREDITKYGVELGLLEAVCVRYGRVDHGFGELKTKGFTISSKGLLKTLVHMLVPAEDYSRWGKASRYLAEHLALEFSYARYDDSSHARYYDFFSSLDNTEFVEISVCY